MPRGVHRTALVGVLIASLGCGGGTSRSAGPRADVSSTTSDEATFAPSANASSSSAPSAAAPSSSVAPIVAAGSASATPVADTPSNSNPWFPDYHPELYKPCPATDRAGLLACLDTPGMGGTEVKGKLIVMVFADARSPSPLGLELVKRGVLSDAHRAQLAAARISVRKDLASKGAPFASIPFADFTVAHRSDASMFTWSKETTSSCRMTVHTATFTVRDDSVSPVETTSTEGQDPRCCIIR